MVRRSYPNQLSSPDDLQRLGELVVDKRFDKRAKAKKNRRNRHYEKQFMRSAVSSGLLQPDALNVDDEPDAGE